MKRSEHVPSINGAVFTTQRRTAPPPRSSPRSLMDAQSIAAFEARAAAAEQRLTALEAKLGASCSLVWDKWPSAVLAAASAPRLPPPTPPHTLPHPAGNAGSSSGSIDASKYVAELLALKEVGLVRTRPG